DCARRQQAGLLGSPRKSDLRAHVRVLVHLATSPRKRYERPAGLFATGVRYAPFPRSPSPFRLSVGSLPGGRAGSGMPDRRGESGDRYAVRVSCGSPGGPVAVGRASCGRAVGAPAVGPVRPRLSRCPAAAVRRACTSVAILTVLWLSTPSPHQVRAPVSP